MPTWLEVALLAAAYLIGLFGLTILFMKVWLWDQYRRASRGR